MSGNSDPPQEVVDLTDLEDRPLNPLRVPSPSTEIRRKRRRDSDTRRSMIRPPWAYPGPRRRRNQSSRSGMQSEERSSSASSATSRNSSFSHTSTEPSFSNSTSTRASRSYSNSSSDDIEILDVQPSVPLGQLGSDDDFSVMEDDIEESAHSDDPVMSSDSVTRSRPRRSSDDGEIDIVDEHRLTPQERLRSIQEKHARGEHVEVQNSSQPQGGANSSSANRRPLSSHERRMRNLMSMVTDRRMLDQTGRYRFPIRYYGAPPAFLDLDNGDDDGDFEYEPTYNEDEYNPEHDRSRSGRSGRRNRGQRGTNPIPVWQFSEEAIMRRTMENSMRETYRRQNLDKIKTPPLPTTTRPGFVHSSQSSGDNETVVCISCGTELGKPRPDSTTAASDRSKQVFVRGCSHVYCGECTFSFKDRSRKDRNCPVAECRTSVSSQKRNKFTQVFI